MRIAKRRSKRVAAACLVAALIGGTGCGDTDATGAGQAFTGDPSVLSPGDSWQFVVPMAEGDWLVDLSVDDAGQLCIHEQSPDGVEGARPPCFPQLGSEPAPLVTQVYMRRDFSSTNVLYIFQVPAEAAAVDGLDDQGDDRPLVADERIAVGVFPDGWLTSLTLTDHLGRTLRCGVATHFGVVDVSC